MPEIIDILEETHKTHHEHFEEGVALLRAQMEVIYLTILEPPRIMPDLGIKSCLMLEHLLDKKLSILAPKYYARIMTSILHDTLESIS